MLHTTLKELGLDIRRASHGTKVPGGCPGNALELT